MSLEEISEYSRNFQLFEVFHDSKNCKELDIIADTSRDFIRFKEISDLEIP